MKNKSIYKIDYIDRFHNCFCKELTKWELIKKFIKFLKDPYCLQFKITKINNIIISKNQTWVYNEKTYNYELHTDLSTKEMFELYKEDKYID